ncbi:VOC family protein [Bacillus sp. REN3]|uniref:VOC family protein n=1 Tax=Bacillus sp. REN3 TaxID=2802440 RepID=UPI001AEEB62B|nr:VOC family protein [Bacillus sp. REN3]
MLHHIEINVSDLKRSIQFWQWFLTDLGYEVYQQWERGISWRFRDTYIVFVQTDNRHLVAGYHRSRIGLNHLAFHARSRKHVDEMTEKLKSKGINILYEDRHPYAGGEGHYAVFFEDPDRIKVELAASSSGH